MANTEKKAFRDFYPVPKNGMIVPVPSVANLSFETGEQGAGRVYVPSKVKLVRVKLIVTKALAATDAGTLTVKDASGSTIATLTVPLSSAIGAEVDSGLITTSNNVIADDSFFDLTTAKTTVGGKIQVSVQYAVMPV